MNHNTIIPNSPLLIGAIALFMSIISWQQFLPSSVGTLIEICDNAIDDDGDGMIDLNDDDCQCAVLEPISRIPNPNFEELVCCPQSRSQLYCANGWEQASAATTDLIHDCGWQGWSDLPPPRPFPSGQGIVGFRDGRKIRNNAQEYNWKEYAGACLSAPLLAGETYKFEFAVGFINYQVSPRIKITFFGSPSCGLLPFGAGDQTIGCPTNATGWVYLQSVSVSGNNEWVKSSLTITPKQDIHAIAIGPPCTPTTVDVNTYYFFDDLVLDELENFEFEISTSNHPCGEDFTLSIPSQENFTQQWYKNGIALLGQNNPSINISENGQYQVRIIRADGSCKVSQIFNHQRPVLQSEEEAYLCQEEILKFGTMSITKPGEYVEKFTSQDGCDSIVYLLVKGLQTSIDSISEKIFADDYLDIAGNKIQEEGEHLILTEDEYGCPAYIHVNLAHFKVYIPNVFSPNSDGQNDYFSIFGGEDLKSVKEISIYNHGGSRVYHEEEMQLEHSRGWDGRDRYGHKLPSEVYTFIALLEMKNGLQKQIVGSVLLLE